MEDCLWYSNAVSGTVPEKQQNQVIKWKMSNEDNISEVKKILNLKALMVNYYDLRLF